MKATTEMDNDASSGKMGGAGPECDLQAGPFTTVLPKKGAAMSGQATGAVAPNQVQRTNSTRTTSRKEAL